jgi:PBP1b-binding outer membrane lipoprotein LpoB
MKKIYLILGLSVLMFSCSNENKMKSEIKNYLDKNAKDPTSYEFVELKILDTVTVGDINKRIVEDLTIDINRLKENIESQKKLISDFPTLPSDAEKQNIKVSEVEISILTKKLDANKKDFTNKEILGYISTHKFRIKNGFGALDLDEMWVEFDKDFKLLKMGEDLNYNVFKK